LIARCVVRREVPDVGRVKGFGCRLQLLGAGLGFRVEVW